MKNYHSYKDSNDIAKKEVTFIVLVDALGKYCINHFDFLKRGTIVRKFTMSTIEGVFGFQSITGAWCAGLYPEDSNLYSIFMYSPQSSPFKVFKNRVIASLMTSLDNVINSTLQFKISYHQPACILRYFIGKLLKKSLCRQRPYITLAEVPYNYLPFFDINELKRPTDANYIPGKLTLFDIFRRFNVKWLYYGTPDSALSIYNSKQINRFLSHISNNTYDFIFLHVTDLDEVVHVYGKRSAKAKVTAKKIDRFLEKTFNLLLRKYNTLNFIVFGDHGMVEVKKTINILRLMKSLPVEVGKDYVMFLDSPSARFWFTNERAKGIIINKLTEIKDGRILTEDDYERYRIRFKHNRFWDLIFLLNPGTIVFPNFFQGVNIVKAMHGYCSFYEENQGLFFFWSNSGREIKVKDTPKLVDLFPTILDLMNLPIPKTSKGKSLVN
jgi:predicted AlkP superfamily pyrophosphatase or phosphodiesterase